MRNKKIRVVTLIVIVILVILWILFPKILRTYRINQLEKARIETLNLFALEAKEEGKKEGGREEAPIQIHLKVPFICQAPLQTEENWKYHEESCEEAAVLQAYAYEKSIEISPNEAHETILDMIKWQEDFFGTHKDLYSDEMKKFITGYYNLKENEVIIIKKAEMEDIKQIVASGKPVIVPITGEILKNPYYPYPGYHMLLVIGYTDTHVITNDNGTRRGKDFTYKIDTFEEAYKDAGGDILYLKLD